MRNRRLFVASAIIAGIILIVFVISIPHTNEVAITSKPVAEVATTTPVLTIRDVYKKGTHTITGTIEAPNACTSVTAEATPVPGETASSTSGILLAISMPPDVGICLQVPTAIEFSATVNAPDHLPISITVNGAPATTTAS